MHILLKFPKPFSKGNYKNFIKIIAMDIPFDYL